MTVKKEELKKEEEQYSLDDSESLGGIKPKSTPETASSFVGNKSTGRSKTKQKRKRSRIIPTSLRKRNVTINEHLDENRSFNNDPKDTHKTKAEEAREKEGKRITDQQDEKARVKKEELKKEEEKCSLDDSESLGGIKPKSTPETASSFVGNRSTGRSKTKQKRKRSHVIPTSLRMRNVTINEHLDENRSFNNDPKDTHKTKAEEAREKEGKRITDQQDEKARVKKGERKTDQQDEEVDNEWTAEKIVILKRMVREVPALTPNFWAVVASRLSTGHSARECNAKYMEVCSKPSSQKHTKAKKAKKTSEADKKNYTITGKAGTLKRKRQLRTAMEHMDRGYTDDIFESTPFRKKVKTIVKLQDFSDSDGEESYSEEEDSDEAYTPDNAQKRLGAPKTHTPKLCDMITTPDFKGGLKRDVADNVMYKIQRAKKPKDIRSKKPKSVPPPKRPRPPTTKPLISEEKLRNIQTGEMSTLRLFEDTDDEDDEDEEMYPFSDIK